MRLGLQRRTLWACVGAGLFAALLPGRAMAAPTIEIVSENPDYHLLAVDGNGMAYGRAIYAGAPQSNRRLYRSTDEGQTWTSIQLFPDLVRSVSVTSKNTLFAHIWGETFDLYRSGDAGVTWQKVFTFPADYRSLTPHSLADVTTSAGHFLFIGSYHAMSGADHMNWIWRSADDGRTWSVVLETEDMRHLHFVQADPYTGFVYAGSGDSPTQSKILRSADAGLTWDPVCEGSSDCRAVDTTFDPAGNLVFGEDVLPPNVASINRLDPDTETITPLTALPGPSYSALALDGESFLVGHTHEPDASDDGKVHLFASDDGGQTFTDAFERAYSNPSSYTVLLAQFTFPNGHFPIQIERHGTIIARLVSSAEAADEPTVSIEDTTAAENSGAATFTVTLSEEPSETVTLQYRTADGSAVSGDVDYEGVTGSITFDPAEPLTREITVPLTDDATDEDDETFALALTGIENAGATDGKGVATIEDDDAEPVVSVAAALTEEGDTASVSVSLDEASGRPVLVDYATESVSATADTDYDPTGGTLTFLPGETTKSVDVETLEDVTDEENETVRVQLSNPVDTTLDAATGGAALLTIGDDDLPPVLAVSGTESLTEGETASFDISLDAASERDITVTYGVGSDEETLEFAPLETTKTVDVGTDDDGLDEPAGELTLQLVDATNATIVAAEDSASTTVLDNDDEPEISIEDASVDEATGSTSTLSFRLTLSAPSGWTIVVPYTAIDGSAHAPGDFTAGGEPVSLAPGDEEGFIEIEVLGDARDEVNESMEIQLGAVEHAEVSAGLGRATGVIRDNDASPVVSVSGEPVVEGQMATFDVSLNAQSEKAITVTYELGSEEGTLEFAPLETAKTVEVETQDDTVDEPDGKLVLQLVEATNAIISPPGDRAVIAVLDNDDPPPPPKVADTTPPFLTVAVFRRGLQSALRRGVPLRVRSSEATDLRIKLRLPARLARRLRLPRVVGAQSRALAAAETAALSPRFSGKARNKLAPLQSFRLVVEVTGTDQSGNVAVFRRAILLKTPA